MKTREEIEAYFDEIFNKYSHYDPMTSLPEYLRDFIQDQRNIILMMHDISECQGGGDETMTKLQEAATMISDYCGRFMAIPASRCSQCDLWNIVTKRCFAWRDPEDPDRSDLHPFRWQLKVKVNEIKELF